MDSLVPVLIVAVLILVSMGRGAFVISTTQRPSFRHRAKRSAAPG